MKELILILLTILLVGHPGAGVRLKPTAEPTAEPIVETVIEPVVTEIVETNSVLVIVNQYRQGRNLPPLITNDLLTKGAMVRAEDLYKSGQFSHEGWLEAIKATGYKGKYVGENLARYFQTDADVVKAWDISEGHADIMYGNFREAGIGKCGTYVVLWVGR